MAQFGDCSNECMTNQEPGKDRYTTCIYTYAYIPDMMNTTR